MNPAPELDAEHETRPDESVAVNEYQEPTSRPHVAPEPAPTSWGPRARLQRSMAEALVTAISTGQIAAVSAAATLQRRRPQVAGFEAPRSMLSQNGAPARVVAVSSLRPVLRRR